MRVLTKLTIEPAHQEETRHRPPNKRKEAGSGMRSTLSNQQGGLVNLQEKSAPPSVTICAREAACLDEPRNLENNLEEEETVEDGENW